MEGEMSSHMQFDELVNSLHNAPDIPPWAATLMLTMQAILTELKGLRALTTRVNEMESLVKVSEKVTSALQAENHDLRDRISRLEMKSEDQEQRNRAYCLLVHGCPETAGENTDDVVLDVLNIHEGLLDIKKSDFVRSHRTGPPKVTSTRNTRSSTAQNDKPRPIIVRFANWNVRTRVFKNKSNLKGKKYVISENLTKQRLELLKKAEMKFGKRNVWTNQGFIKAKINDKFISITSEDNLN